ncbi:MAG: penicillin-binding protein [Lachnospiraceae bacterium]|nr:penicillin-binding protein [Lachnospiraceae bacterium]
MAKETNKKKHPILFILVLILSTILLGLIVVSPYMVDRGRYVSRAKKMVEGSDIDTFKNSHTSVVYNDKDEEIAFFKSKNDMYYISYDNIPEYAKLAFTVLHDRNYFDKESIGYVDQVKVVIDSKNIDKMEDKLSHIERTVARNVFMRDDVEGVRKKEEIFISIELSKKYSKEQVLEFYLNNIYFGNGYYGVETAARGYFGKSLSELSFSQIAFLAAVCENPIKYDPFTNKEVVLIQRNYIVTKLKDYELINRADYYRGISEEIVITPLQNKAYQYAESYILHSATLALMEHLGTIIDPETDYDLYTKEYSKYQQSIFTNGYKIYTTINTDMQKSLEESVVQGTAAYADDVDAMGVCIDNETGCVVAIVGGKENATDYYSNPVYQSKKAALNVLWPLNVYTPFIEWHHNPDYIIYQEATVSGTYINKITLREAIISYPGRFERQILSALKQEYSDSFLYRMGYTNLDEGITCLELAVGYATLADDGQYKKTGCIRKITSVADEELVVNPYTKSVIYAPNDARIMTDILKEKQEKSGITVDGAITAGYLASSKEAKEAWYVGYSRYYTTAVWMGHELDKDDIQLNPAGIWSSYMQAIHTDLEELEFEKYGEYTDMEGDFIPPEIPTERPSLGGTGGYPDDGDWWVK